MTSGTSRREVFYVESAQRHSSPIPEGVKAGGFIFLSAIRGVDPAVSPTRVDIEDPYEQAKQALKVVRTTLEAVGATLQDICKVAIYVTDINDRPALNKAWQEVFPVDPPARFVVQVARFGSPGDHGKFLFDVTAIDPATTKPRE
jgi:2-iminobutanoate/2-iminopropanoate deaminase